MGKVFAGDVDSSPSSQVSETSAEPKPKNMITSRPAAVKSANKGKKGN